MRRTYQALIAAAIILTIVPFSSALNNQLEAGKISIDNISVEISTPPVWGDPGELVLDVPGNDMFKDINGLEDI